MPIPQQRPFSITIFVPDGDPDSLRYIEKSNWTGIGVVFNKSIFKDVRRCEEFDRTGVYILIGQTGDSSQPTIYVGEGDPVLDRLNDHHANKGFWDWAVFFVTKDNSLNKAHVQHLEARLLELAHAAKQCKLENTQKPTVPTLSKSQTADVESFLLDILGILPLVGLSVFEKTETTSKPDELLHIEAKGIKAIGYLAPKGFVVTAGSQMVMEETNSIPTFVTTIRKDLLDQGIVVPQGAVYVFTQDQPFKSLSTAAAVVQGRSANGRDDWKNKAGVSLKKLQEATEAKPDVLDHF
jgi:hypothetical protein